MKKTIIDKVCSGTEKPEQTSTKIFERPGSKIKKLTDEVCGEVERLEQKLETTREDVFKNFCNNPEQSTDMWVTDIGEYIYKTGILSEWQKEYQENSIKFNIIKDLIEMYSLLLKSSDNVEEKLKIEMENYLTTVKEMK